MSLAILTLLLAGASPAIGSNSASAALIDANCPRATAMHASGPARPVKPQKLADLPPANAYKAVYRLVRGCEVPMVVTYGIGSR
jgi:hypothetical protein